jgi:hypothetical protein
VKIFDGESAEVGTGAKEFDDLSTATGYDKTSSSVHARELV